MSVVQSIIIAVACFSAIPMPFVAWDEHNMRYMLAAFPLVGVVVGACTWLWGSFCTAFGIGPFLQGVGYALVPLLVTGGIHMDGFADVVDALSSHALPERKRAILKDPHVGAFAVMGIWSYLAAYAALASELDPKSLPVFAAVPVVSRCLSGIASLTWPLASKDGSLASMRSKANVKRSLVVLFIELLLAAAFMLMTDFVTGRRAILAALAAFAWSRYVALHEFEGLNGDVAGYLLQVVELAMLICIVVSGRLA